MGQYHVIVNLDKWEYLCPYQFGCGAKAWEQLANFPSPVTGLFPLLVGPCPRGGGDIACPDAAGEQVLGRWAGDRIAVIGDYAEDADMPGSKIPLSKVYDACRSGLFREISDLVRPVLCQELSLSWSSEQRRFTSSSA